MLRTTILTAAFLAFVSPAFAQSDTWRTIDGPGFTVEMPGQPEYSMDTDKTPEGDLLTHQYVVDEGDGKRVFVATAIVYPYPVKIPDPKKSLQTFSESMESAMDSKKWTTVRSIDVKGLPALDTTGVRDGSDVRSVMVINDHQLVALVFVAPKGQTKPADVSHFIDSMKLK